ncbi:MAG: hypothetical protein KAJ51_06450, partial [Thermoplasmata archaeon]|nr:hypothetical protein [Thermoplasmata archaeon]
MKETVFKKAQSKKQIVIFIVLILISGTFLTQFTHSFNDLTPQDSYGNVDGIGSEPDNDPTIEGSTQITEPTTTSGSDKIAQDSSRRGAETSVVRVAIRKGLDYLASTQADDGGWDTINYGKPAALGSFGLRAFL